LYRTKRRAKKRKAASLELDRNALVYYLPFLLSMGIAASFPVPVGELPAPLNAVRLGAALGLFLLLAKRGAPRPLRARWGSVGAGLAGAFVWVGMGALESGASATPPSATPLPLKALGFIVVTPLLEEFFFRGFVQRALGEREWWAPPAAKWRLLPLFGTALLFAALHRPHFFTALCWFGFVTLWLGRARSLWDAVLTHAATNLGAAILVALLARHGLGYFHLL
jgi:membrane protease YdiL (CAAX protease family)